MSPQHSEDCVGVSAITKQIYLLGESWTYSKKGFNNMGNGRQDEKYNNWEQTAEDGSSDSINSAGTMDVNDSSGPFFFLQAQFE